jgi:rubredoxin
MGDPMSERRIAIHCLSCGHATSLAEDDLPSFGLATDTPLATLTRRLVCRECGSKSVQTFRYVSDAPDTAPP